MNSREFAWRFGKQMTMYRGLALCMAILVLHSCKVAAQTATPLKEMELTTAGYRLHVSFRLMTLPENEVESWYGVVSQARPTSTRPRTFAVIKAFHIWRQGKLLHIPASASSGLSQIRQATIHKTKGGTAITLKGGDAAGAYVARLYHNHRGGIVKRVVSSGDNPNQEFEQTRYTPGDY